MRHRKKLIFATLVVLAVYSTVCFWPHSNPEAVRALAALRGLVDDQPIASAPVTNPQRESHIEVSLLIGKLNITDATTGLFCRSGHDAHLTIGRISDEIQMTMVVDKLASLGVLDLNHRTQLLLLAGQTGCMASGNEYLVSTAAAAGGPAPPPAVVRTIGTRLEVTPEILTDDSIRLTIDCKLSWLGVRKTGTQDILELRATTRGHVKPGETLIIGGLTKKWDAPTIFRLPLLSDLPGVGGWLRFERQREIEEELIILATPRIVLPSTRRDTERAVIDRPGEQGVDD